MATSRMVVSSRITNSPNSSTARTIQGLTATRGVLTDTFPTGSAIAWPTSISLLSESADSNPSALELECHILHLLMPYDRAEQDRHCLIAHEAASRVVQLSDCSQTLRHVLNPGGS